MAIEIFELGPLQKLWIKSLREHPERQIEAELGYGTPKKYQACCLGELHVCYHRLHYLKLPFYHEQIRDQRGKFPSDPAVLANSYKRYNLLSYDGEIKKEYRSILNKSTLSLANDNGHTWKEIADFVEKYPQAVFTRAI